MEKNIQSNIDDICLSIDVLKYKIKDLYKCKKFEIYKIQEKYDQLKQLIDHKHYKQKFIDRTLDDIFDLCFKEVVKNEVPLFQCALYKEQFSELRMYFIENMKLNNFHIYYGYHTRGEYREVEKCVKKRSLNVNVMTNGYLYKKGIIRTNVNRCVLYENKNTGKCFDYLYQTLDFDNGTKIETVLQNFETMNKNDFNEFLTKYIICYHFEKNEEMFKKILEFYSLILGSWVTYDHHFLEYDS